jgi:RNA-directed DNA polymerase
MQQAIAQVIGPLLEPHFSTYSYGFRPGRRATMAHEEIQEAYREGPRYAADGDLRSFFDTVNHHLLGNRLARRSTDRRVLRRIGRYVRVGVILSDGGREPAPWGIPQDGPLSLPLANVRLDDLDAELERRGRRYARHADDVLIVIRSQRAAERVVHSISRCIERRLQLRINPAKTKAAGRSVLHLSWLREKKGDRFIFHMSPASP